MRDLNITLVQTGLHWHDPEANREALAARLRPLVGQSDLVILPEMFTTGFTMDAAAHAETMNGPSVAWLAAQAKALEAVVTGSLVIEAAGRFHNRLIWMRPDGSFDCYDKRHLFRMADEHHHYRAGSDRLIVELHGWRVMPLVCYDLRFPVWSRNRDDCDLLLYVANWPARRAGHWRALLPARAIENQVYVAAVNRIGEDGNGIAYRGDSALIDPLGEHLVQLGPVANVVTATLSAERLRAYRERFPAHRDADGFTLDTPGA